MAKYCSNCGAQAADEAKFCLSCGQRFAAEPPPTQQAPYYPGQQAPYQPSQPAPYQPSYQAPYQPAPRAAKERPGCVIVYLILMILFSLLILLVSLGTGSFLADIMPVFGAGSGTGIAIMIVGLVITALLVAVAIGAYELKSWAPIAAIVIHSLLALLNVVGLFGIISGSDLTGYTPTGSIVVAIVIIVLQGIAIWWFAQNRKYFTY